MTFKLLVVDDHPETRSIIVRVLQQEGYQVVSAANGAEGLKLADVEKPDLIMLDFMMPIMDGRETCERLRQRPEMAKVPIIMFTAVDDPQQKLSVFDAGADDYLNKPTEPAELVERVKTMLETVYGTLPETNPRDKTTLHSRTDAPVFLDSAPFQPMGSQLVAVTGARGGAGATTVAINLAATLSGLGYVTTLVDLDLDQGHVGAYLNHKSQGVNALAALPDNEIAEQLPEFSLPHSPNLRLLLAQMNLNGRFPHLSGPQTAVLMTTLSQTNQFVVADLGIHTNEIGRAVLAQADHVLVCLRPERIALSTARQMLAHLKETLPAATTLNALMLDFNDKKVQLPQTAVEGFLNHPLLATISIPSAELTRAVNQAKPVVQLNAQAETNKQFRQLARQLIKVPL
jgi:CheY-like chemotaxis protein